MISFLVCSTCVDIGSRLSLARLVYHRINQMAAFVKRLLHRCCPCGYESDGEDVRPKTVNIVVGFFWLVNMQVGTGFLGIPFSFGHGGLIAGAATLVVIAFVSWITGIWILEVIARAQV